MPRFTMFLHVAVLALLLGAIYEFVPVVAMTR